MKKTIKLLAAVLTILSISLGLNRAEPVDAAEAIDTTQQCTLAMKFHGASEQDPMPGVSVHLYRVADIDAGGSYTLAGDFKNLSVTLSNAMSASQWSDLAVTLDAYIQSEAIAAQASGTTDSSGIVTFQPLSVGLYLVRAEQITVHGIIYTYEPELITLPYLNAKDDSWIYDTSAAPVAVKSEMKSAPKSYTVVKHWNDSDAAGRPSEITVNLIKNGTVDSQTTLNDSNDWSYTWSDPDAADAWTVSEADVPAGYTVSVATVTQDQFTVFTMTNTTVPVTPTPSAPVPTPSDTQLPFTGQYWWPVIVLAGTGLVLLAIGWFLVRRHAND